MAGKRRVDNACDDYIPRRGRRRGFWRTIADWRSSTHNPNSTVSTEEAKPVSTPPVNFVVSADATNGLVSLNSDPSVHRESSGHARIASTSPPNLEVQQEIEEQQPNSYYKSNVPYPADFGNQPDFVEQQQDVEDRTDLDEQQPNLEDHHDLEEQQQDLEDHYDLEDQQPDLEDNPDLEEQQGGFQDQPDYEDPLDIDDLPDSDRCDDNPLQQIDSNQSDDADNSAENDLGIGDRTRPYVEVLDPNNRERLTFAERCSNAEGQASDLSIKSLLQEVIPENITDLTQLLEEVLQGVRRYITVGTFTGLILLYGPAPLSCRQYLLVTTLVGYFLRALKTFQRNDAEAQGLKSRVQQRKDSTFSCGITKVRQKVFPHIVNNVLPKSLILSFPAGKQSIKPTEDWDDESSTWCDTDAEPIGVIADIFNDETGIDKGQSDSGNVEANNNSQPHPESTARVQDHCVQNKTTRSRNNTSDQRSAVQDSTQGVVSNQLRERTSINRDPNRIEENTAQVTPTQQPAEMKDCLVVRASEWARYDLLNTDFLDTLKRKQESIEEASHSPNLLQERSFATSRLMTQPSTVYDRDRKLWVRSMGSGFLEPANVGDCIQVNSLLSTRDVSFIQSLRGAGWKCSANLSYFDAKLTAVWNGGSKSVNNGNSNSREQFQCSISSPAKGDLDDDVQLIIEYLESHLQHPSVLAASLKSHNATLSRRSKRGGKRRPEIVENHTLLHNHSLLPGDTCSVLEATKEVDINGDRIIAVLVDRFLRSKVWPSNKFILWFRIGSRQAGTSTTEGTNVEVIKLSKSTAQPTLTMKTNAFTEELLPNQNIMGTLQTGEKYYVYRFALYSDDFGPRSTLFPRGSVGGVYLRPVDVPIRVFRSPHSIHPVSLSPTSVNSNVIIGDVVKDILHQSYNGFNSIDADGVPCKIFLQLVGYVGDYPESSAVADVMKHSARAPCTLCNFRYKKTPHGASYCKSPTSSSLNSSFTRGWFRTKALRYTGLSAKELKWLGMNPGDLRGLSDDMNEDWILLKLSYGFDQSNAAGKKAPKTTEGKPVVTCRFDPYLQNMVAPDHCITGIVKSVLKVCFEELSGAQRPTLDCTLVAAITKMGVKGQTTIYNEKAKKLNGLSMSTLFAIIAVLPSVLLACGFKSKLNSFPVIKTLATLVSLMYWWPTKAGSDVDSFQYVHHSNKYFIDMERCLMDFVSSLHTYYERDGARACSIDSPNVHRLMELVTTTIPVYGHCLLLAELPFEAFHQSLKKTLSKNTTTRSHLTAMKCVLFTDWFRHVSTAMANVGDGPSRSKQLVELGKLLIPFGHFLFHDELKDEQLPIFRESIVDHINNDLLGPLSSFMSDQYSTSLYQEETAYVWCSSSKIQNKPMLDSKLPSGLQEFGFKALCEATGILTGLNSDEHMDSIEKVKIIEQKRDTTLPMSSNASKSYQRLSKGDAVQVVCRFGTENNFIIDAIDSNQKYTISHGSHYFVLMDLYKVERDNYWAIVVRLQIVDGEHHKFIITEDSLQLLKLTDTVSKCGLLHHCDVDKNCKIGRRAKKIRHKPARTGEFNVFLISSKSGYPFRSA